MKKNITITPVIHRVVSVYLQPNNPQDKENDKFEQNLTYSIFHFTEAPDEFSVLFQLKIEKNFYEIECIYETKFKVSEKITEEFLNSDFAKISAPAIGFPFLRAFVSFLTLTAGYKSLMLPSVNFTKYDKTKIKIIKQ